VYSNVTFKITVMLMQWNLKKAISSG